ncbi:multidrug ABC transporter ATP-binding protein [Paenibacillus crassostreae]|uniref:Multidrug ABC transporter ATP-binding protein n=2 Tax=Paenibacillus crassostreae TaxID=1763538 RepID=A0A167BHR9_9BACL|nr:ABC transporter ATP-binding protein [Paenibacillus crassostreae]AOZ94709.1 multidrug ABC transporter ATP-binding protein [Paenibacillus crassostreae]OAB72079.1 multidrug ABC transporter ATP-binding protein [Paenibacillus crassostreae]
MAGGIGMPGKGPGLGTTPKVRPKNTLATIKKLWTYLKRQRVGLILVYISTFLSAVISLVGPYLIGKAIDDYIIPKDHNGLIWLCLLMLGIYVLGSAVSWVQSYVMSGVSQRTVLDLRHDLFEKYQQLPLKFFDTHSTGELMSRTTNDIENVSNSLNQSVIQLLTSMITLSGSLVIMLSLNLPLTLVSLVTIPLVVFATRKIATLTRRYFKGQQRHLGELNGFIEETIQGQKVVKLYRRESMEIKRFKGINQQLNTMGIKAQIVSGLVGPVMNAVNNLNFALIAAIGGWMVFKDLTTVGVIVSFLNYSKQFGRPITELANQYNLIQSAVAGAERVFEIMELKSEYTEDDEVIVSNDLQGHVTFDNVSFNYRPDSPILQQVSFVAKPGEKIALVGPTGAGKTTIVNLLTRFYDIDEGQISIDGIDIRQMDKNSLRMNLGMVLQDAYVFSGSIRENIRFGRLDATDEEVQAAAQLANADGFISRLPHGYDMLLQAGGSNLSHGQRQLLTIARAILANPSVLILDEATSSVDTRTEMHIQEAMKNLMQGRTSFVIAHRLSTIQDADQILVMHGGRIIERGNHEQLLIAKGFYYELYSGQFKRVI